MPVVPFTAQPPMLAPQAQPDPVYVAMSSSLTKKEAGDAVSNLSAADKELNLTPQEKFLYNMHVNNLYGPGGVDNPDGSRSTLYQSVEEHNGRYYNVPTVWNGKIETEKWTDPKSGKVWDVPNKTARDNIDRIGWDKFPSYRTPEEADARYQKMHDYMEKDTASYLKRRKR